MQRFYITLGAPTTAEGKVISANHLDTIDGVPMALEGDKCWCPACDAEGIIVLDGPRLGESFEGREFALSDDLCACKCNPPPRLVAAQTFAYQLIDSDRHAAQAGAAAQRHDRRNDRRERRDALKELWQPSGAWQWLEAWRNWLKMARESDIEPLHKFANKLKPYWQGIASRLRWPMHTGQLEGINNRIKVMKRMAYGYRDSSFFFLKIKAAFPGNP